jgi:hypothetical protein
MVTITDKAALLAFVNTYRQGHLLPVTAIAASLTRVSGIHSLKRPAGAFSLAFRYYEKLSLGHVKNGLCETVVLDHPANVQIFDSDPVEALDQISRHFVVKLFARSLYPQVPERYSTASFTTILAAYDAPQNLDR